MKKVWKLIQTVAPNGSCVLFALISIGCLHTDLNLKSLSLNDRSLGFAQDIKPVMTKFCIECHGIKSTEADLDLRTLSSILSGGESGPSIMPGHPGQSILFDMIHDEHMPPEGKLLRKNDIERVRRWIASGARP